MPNTQMIALSMIPAVILIAVAMTLALWQHDRTVREQTRAKTLARLFGLMGKQRDALRDRYDQAQYHATHDPLTGAPNRYALAQQWPRLAFGRPTIAVIDLNQFKKVNDTWGHAVGDALLVEAARRLCSRLPEQVFRIGGDEFVAILPGHLGAAGCLAQRLADDLATAYRLPETDDKIYLTASIGIARSVEGDLRRTKDAADIAMFRAKRERLTVAVFDPQRDRASRVAPDRENPVLDARWLGFAHSPVPAVAGVNR